MKNLKLSNHLWLLLSGSLVMMIGLSGCYPGGVETTSELDIVYTDYDDDYFASKAPRTYFMRDTVIVLFDPDNDDPGDIELPPATERLILDKIAGNLNALGYTRLDELEENNLPDVVVLVEVAKNRWVGGGCYYPWYPGWGWGGWYPGWGWGPGWGYPCYPSYYSYETGTLSWQMIDPDESDVENKVLGVVWLAGLNGLVRSSSGSNQSVISAAIDQAFEQSPYLAQ